MLAVALIVSALLAAAPDGTDELRTVFEQSGGVRTSSYAETVALCRSMAAASPWVRYETFGTSGEGRDLPLLIVDSQARFSPERAHDAGNAVVLVQAGIHAGEIDGKDAGLLLIRAMAVDRSLSSLLDHVTLVFIPIYNVDGHERVSPFNRPNQTGPENMGFRANASELNLNRDYLKADAPETRAWLSLFSRWKPDLFIDCHVSDGADYQYAVTYVIEQWQNADPGVAAWSRERWEAQLAARMEASRFPITHYCQFRVWEDPRSGMKSGVATPRFSTGYCALRNRPALLIETHMIKDYATRVRGTYEMLRHSVAIAGEEHTTLRKIVAEADARTSTAAFRHAPLPLAFEVSDDDSVVIDFLGLEYERTTSDITGGDWYRFSSTPARWQIPYFPSQNVTSEALLPEAYVIPPQWTQVIERLDAHGIAYTRLREDRRVRISTVRFRDVAWQEQPFEGHHPLTYAWDEIEEDRLLRAGTVLVDLAQPAAKVVANLLEPGGPDALVRWDYLDSIFEYKEYVEAYVIEKMIREMLARDPGLAGEFEGARRDPAIASDPAAIRRWFYRRTPYFEDRVGVYPIGRIRDRGVADDLGRSAQ